MLTTQQVVDYLNQYVIGQPHAKHAIAIAHRERSLKALHGKSDSKWSYITPSNILLIGNSGTGKSEIARSLAKMSNAPLVKIEITQYSQVGYYGKDVSTIMSDLLKEAIRIAPRVWAEEQKEQANSYNPKELEKLKPVYYAETALIAAHLKVDPEKLTWEAFMGAYVGGKLNKLSVLHKYRIDILTAAYADKDASETSDDSSSSDMMDSVYEALGDQFGSGFFKGLKAGKQSDIYIKEMVEMLAPVDVRNAKHVEILGKTFDSKTLSKILTRISNNSVGRRRLTAFFTGMAPDQLKAWCDKLGMTFATPITSLLKLKKNTGRGSSEIPKEFIVKLIEERGIVFIDEFDKIFLDKDGGNVGNVGVVRDLMPYLDGITTNVSTKGEREMSGMFGGSNETYRINTANILFVVAGAFHLAKVEDVPAEILGRLPVHVRLKSLTIDDLIQVIKKPHGSELTRMQLMMDAEGVDFKIDDDAVKAIAELVFACNKKGEDLGARRIIGVMRLLFDQYRFDASNGKDVQIVVTRKYVEGMAKTILADVIDRPELPDETQKVMLELPKSISKKRPQAKPE